MQEDITKILHTISEDINFKNGINEMDDRITNFENGLQSKWSPGIITHKNGKQIECNLIIDMGTVVFCGVGEPFEATPGKVKTPRSATSRLKLPLMEMKEHYGPFTSTENGENLVMDSGGYWVSEHEHGSGSRRQKLWSRVYLYGKIISINKVNILDIVYTEFRV